MRLTLTDAVHTAIRQNRALKIARLKVTENEYRKTGEHAAYFPTIQNESNALHITGSADYRDSGGGDSGLWRDHPFRRKASPFRRAKLTFFTSGTQISQPLTQLIRIHQANRIAAAEVAISRDDLKKAENQVALDVHTLYFGILIARLQKQAADQQTAYAGENLRESEDDVRNGSGPQNSGDSRPRQSA